MNLLHNVRKEHRSYITPNVRQIPTEEYFRIVREKLATEGCASVRVTGVSMKPFLFPIRDTVEVIPPNGSLKRGDIALYDTHRGRYILHRVTRVGEQDFDMRGDNTAQGEKYLPKAFMVGIVASATRNGRHIMRDSFLFWFFASISPAHYTWAFCRNRFLYPIVSKMYHIFIPRQNGGK